MRSAAKAEAFAAIVKIGRTHMQDATPADAGAGVLRLRGAGRVSAPRAIAATLPDLSPLAQGGTAVGTGLNAHPGFADGVRGADRRRSPACRS